jgi:hypothetical protein
MGAQPYSLELPESRRSWSIPMAGLILAIVAAGAVAGINALLEDSVEAVRPAAEFSAYQGAVTGTGPALESVKGQSLASYEGVVTGTGPALESVAGQSLASYEGAVTGTGPALLEVAGEARSGFAGGLVTGTGPGLVEIAGDTFAEYRGPVTGTGPALGSMGK